MLLYKCLSINEAMNYILCLLFFCLSPSLFATQLRMEVVKQVVYLEGGALEDKLRIVDVPVVTAYASPESLLSAVGKPFVPLKDDSWTEPKNVNMVAAYGIKLRGEYDDGGERYIITIDLSEAAVPSKLYPFSVEEVTAVLETCLEQMWEGNEEIYGKLSLQKVQPKAE